MSSLIRTLSFIPSQEHHIERRYLGAKRVQDFILNSVTKCTLNNAILNHRTKVKPNTLINVQAIDLIAVLLY